LPSSLQSGMTMHGTSVEKYSLTRISHEQQHLEIT
jgi:hypothetical protein